MFYVSEITKQKPNKFKNELHQKVYDTLEKLNIVFERVDTDEAITMNDCTLINQKLNMNMVKTLFLSNRQETKFYLFITKGDKHFDSKKFSQELEIPRVSFAKEEKMKEMLGTLIGAATILSTILDKDNQIEIVIDADILKEEYYGCSDTTTTSYLKIKTTDIINTFLKSTSHEPKIINM